PLPACRARRRRRAAGPDRRDPRARPQRDQAPPLIDPAPTLAHPRDDSAAHVMWRLHGVRTRRLIAGPVAAGERERIDATGPGSGALGAQLPGRVARPRRPADDVAGEVVGIGAALGF